MSSMESILTGPVLAMVVFAVPWMVRVFLLDFLLLAVPSFVMVEMVDAAVDLLDETLGVSFPMVVLVIADVGALLTAWFLFPLVPRNLSVPGSTGGADGVILEPGFHAVSHRRDGLGVLVVSVGVHVGKMLL